MAEIVPDFPMTNKRGDFYPWHDWFNGKTWKLIRGIDFEVSEDNFRTCAIAASRRKGIRIATHIPSNEIGTVYIRKTGIR